MQRSQARASREKSLYRITGKSFGYLWPVNSGKPFKHLLPPWEANSHQTHHIFLALAKLLILQKWLAQADLDVARKISALKDSLNRGDLTKLKAIQEAILQTSAPMALKNELITKLRSEKISYIGDEGGWNRSWMAIKKVWASKWNERAYISCKKTKVDHDAICMAVLIQQVICGEYAFVIHTNNPVSGDSSEIYTDVKKLLQFLRFRVIESNY
ncbi:unnamed protein product [Arabis nemorensis]|uniref:Pyruvate phosphate dikinase AMP/ATP-binding domain-containing protein n=1 Tax=Arabis nemorensis TaxID=586526 RepID=A0A565AU17_9BRAS|nr:unnamed protein product [Arabis nemorensis]